MMAFGRLLAPALAAMCALLPRRAAGLELRAASAARLQPRGVEDLYGADTEDGGWMARVSEPEMKDSLLNFEHASLKHSNLGGLGPDRGQEALIISQVGLVGGVSINMRFSVADGYAYDA